MAEVTRPRRVREVLRRADAIAVGDRLYRPRGDTYSEVLSIRVQRDLYRGEDSLGRSRVLRRPVYVFRLADGSWDHELPGNVCEVLEVLTWR